MKSYTLTLCCLIFLSILTGQRNIGGVVVDASSGSPLPFVHIFLLEEQSHGVISNEKGEFQISITEEQEKDALTFSILGYETVAKPLGEIEGSTFNLKMSHSFIALAEIVVTSDLGLRNVVRRCLEKVAENYGHEEYLIRGYYREFALSDGQYSKFTEAMVTIPDGTYGRLKNVEKGWLDEFRQSDNYRHETFKNGFNQIHREVNSQLFFYGFRNKLREGSIYGRGGIDQLYDMQFRNRGEYLDGKDTIMRIEYRVGQLFDLEGESFDPTRFMYRGDLLVNLSDYAILRNTLYYEGEPFIDVVYHKYKGKYYPKRLHAYYDFEHGEGLHRHQEYQMLYFYDVLVSKEERKAYKKGRPMRYYQQIEDQKFKYDPAFWEDNQILLRVPAPDALEVGIGKGKSLEEQFRDNARRIKE